MAENSGSVPMDEAERERLLALYNLEDHLFTCVHEKFKQRKHISPFDFYCVVYWKSNRNRKGIREGLGKSDPGKLFDEVREARKPKAKVEALIKVKGIGIAIASAILAVCYPEEYSVVDSLVFKLVKKWGYLSDASLNVGGYLRYNEWCLERRDEWRIKLREVDRIVWRKAWEEGLKGWLSGAGQ